MKKCNKGFTLIELLATTMIVLILVLMTMVGIKRNVESARSVQCVGNLRQIGAAISQYASEHGGERPAAWSGTPNASTKVTSFGTHLWHVAAQLLSPPKNATADELRYYGDGYLSDAKLFFSPTQKNYHMDDRGGFRQKNGSWEMGYIYYVVGENLYNGDLLEQTANNRIMTSGRLPLLSTFGRDATLTLNAPPTDNKTINILHADGAVSSMSLKEAEKGLSNSYSKDELAKLMMNLAGKPQ